MRNLYHVTLYLVVMQEIFVECLLCVRHFPEAGAYSHLQILSALASPVDPRGLGQTAVVAAKISSGDKPFSVIPCTEYHCVAAS